jgi:hypothetical protein
MGNALEHTSTGINFLSRTPIAQHLREMIDKWDCIKIKSFCTAKETVNRLKKQTTEWQKIFTSYTSDKSLITIIYRKLKNPTL